MGNFSLYIGIDNLLNLFTDKSFLMLFWIHFVSINLFIGGWMVKESQKFSINNMLLALPLITTYLIGPIGLLLFWIVKVFHSKSINLYD